MAALANDRARSLVESRFFLALSSDDDRWNEDASGKRREHRDRMWYLHIEGPLEMVVHWSCLEKGSVAW